jgi:CO/xanthine dehydrogenase Mo-binding subunit
LAISQEDFSMEQMTIREAARELGITPQALRSRAKHRGVILEKAPGPHGERYLVNAADLPLLRDGTVPQDRPVEPSRENVSQANDVIPLSAHLEVIHLLRETQRHLQEAQEQRHKSQEAMRLLERQTMALQWELTNYRRALSENAESLAEQAARARQVEYQVQLAELRADQALAEKSLLAEDNQRQKEEFEREKAAMAEGSRTSVPKIGWLKQKAPRWVRRLLGAG